MLVVENDKIRRRKENIKGGEEYKLVHLDFIGFDKMLRREEDG